MKAVSESNAELELELELEESLIFYVQHPRKLYFIEPCYPPKYM